MNTSKGALAHGTYMCINHICFHSDGAFYNTKFLNCRDNKNEVGAGYGGALRLNSSTITMGK